MQTINENGLTTTPVTTDIASLRSDGSPFPTERYTSVYKNAYSALEELSQTDFTGDNLPYIFWFDEDDVFHWQFPNQTVSSTVLKYDEDPVTSMKAFKKEAESISMIIFNTGEDLNGNTRIGFHLDPNAATIKNKNTAPIL